MKWWWILITVASGSLGDVLGAYGMAQHEPLGRLNGARIVRVLRYCVTHKSVVVGIIANAVSFVSFMALLSVEELSYAVPVTALGYIVRTVLARMFLHEYVNAMRWMGLGFIVAGIVMISI